MSDPTRRGIRSAQLGLLINTILAAVKLAAGLVGHSYALVADAVESTADIFSSLIVWGGLHLAGRPPDEDHPYGHGKAEALAGAVVSLMLLVAAVGIGIEAVREIRTPHSVPAPWTLVVLVAVMVIKFWLSRHVTSVAAAVGSTAVRADAWHHLSDALTSAAAFIGISLALIGTRLNGRPGWAAADDWAALFASGVIALNGLLLVRPALHDLMDRLPGTEIVAAVRRAAASVPGILGVDSLRVRKSGLAYLVDIHVEAAPDLPLRDAHALSGRVESAIRAAIPQVASVLVHMEPHERATATTPLSSAAPRH
jgi:cation diffusion facilitator family transporter